MAAISAVVYDLISTNDIFPVTKENIAYGYRVNAGSMAGLTTSISNMKIRIQSMILQNPSGAAGCKATLTDGKGNPIMVMKGSSVNGESEQVWFDKVVDGLSVNLDTAGSVFLAMVK